MDLRQKEYQHTIYKMQQQLEQCQQSQKNTENEMLDLLVKFKKYITDNKN